MMKRDMAVVEADPIGVSDPVGESDPAGEEEPVGESDAVGETDPVGKSDPVGESDSVGEVEPVGESGSATCWVKLPKVDTEYAGSIDDLMGDAADEGVLEVVQREKFEN